MGTSKSIEGAVARGFNGANDSKSHHHRHPKLDEERAASLVGQRSSSTQFNTGKLSQGNLSQSGHLTGHRHHHHTPHHHHRLPGTGAHHPQIPKEKRPTVIIKTKPLLESLSHLPREHVGSQLYAPRVTPPPTLSTPLFAKFLFATHPHPLPRFDETQQNCTFTVRVPRFYLSDASREHIVSQRKVWGTDVYTDDSDPIAAAIHNGWIRGAWGEDVDVSLLEDLELNGTGQKFPAQRSNGGNDEDGSGIEPAGDKKRVLDSPPPSGPVIPPPDHDAHITLLILPALEKYAPSTWHGIRSRAWGDNHDGMSFKVQQVEWVDEGPETRWEDRSYPTTLRTTVAGQRGPTSSKAEARRQRLHEKWKNASTKAGWSCGTEAVRCGEREDLMIGQAKVKASAPASLATA